MKTVDCFLGFSKIHFAFLTFRMMLSTEDCTLFAKTFVSLSLSSSKLFPKIKILKNYGI